LPFLHNFISKIDNFDFLYLDIWQCKAGKFILTQASHPELRRNIFLFYDFLALHVVYKTKSPALWAGLNVLIIDADCRTWTWTRHLLTTGQVRYSLS